MTGSAFHEAAQAYAARGWAVFPLKPRDKTPMIGPSKPGAHDGGFHLATRDAEQIAKWWAKWPDANIGLRCGEESGVFVLDLDGPGAEAALGQLQAAHGALPSTLQQRTGKGRHLLFRHAAGVRNRGGGYLVDGKRVPCAGFDVRGEGGYIVLPPSVHPSGRVYKWTLEGEAIAEAPRWLLDAIVPPAPKPSAAAQVYADRFRGGRATAYGEKALDSACRRIATAQPGTQNTTLTGEAASIGELVGGGEIEAAYATRALQAAAEQMATSREPWLSQQIAEKIAWGLAVGQSRPRKVTREERRDRRTPTVLMRDEKAAENFSARLAIAPPEAAATLIVATEDDAERAALAWEASHGGAYGLFVTRDLQTLVGGLACNSGGFPDWRLPRADIARPGATMRWNGRVLVVLPDRLQSFTVSKGTKWERFISVERHTQVLGILATHWWRHAGASDVQVAVLPSEAEAA